MRNLILLGQVQSLYCDGRLFQFQDELLVSRSLSTVHLKIARVVV